MQEELMKLVYVVEHYREDETSEDYKLLGLFSTEVKAKEAISKLVNLPGFKDYPEGFSVNSHTIDKVLWTDGFG